MSCLVSGRYPDNVLVVGTAGGCMEDCEIVAVTDIGRDEVNELFVKGRKFKNIRPAHDEWNLNLKYPSLKHIGCYEARAGLNEEEETFPFSSVVGKCFPFHMLLESSCDPLEWTSGSLQWWVLIRLKHTCPPVTFPDLNAQ